MVGPAPCPGSPRSDGCDRAVFTTIWPGTTTSGGQVRSRRRGRWRVAALDQGDSWAAGRAPRSPRAVSTTPAQWSRPRSTAPRLPVVRRSGQRRGPVAGRDHAGDHRRDQVGRPTRRPRPRRRPSRRVSAACPERGTHASSQSSATTIRDAPASTRGAPDLHRLGPEHHRDPVAPTGVEVRQATEQPRPRLVGDQRLGVPSAGTAASSSPSTSPPCRPEWRWVRRRTHRRWGSAGEGLGVERREVSGVGAGEAAPSSTPSRAATR
jgi:hypothetical protein